MYIVGLILVILHCGNAWLLLREAEECVAGQSIRLQFAAMGVVPDGLLRSKVGAVPHSSVTR